MQTYKYLILSLVLLGTSSVPVKATNLSPEDVAVINKSLDERFARLQKHLNRTMPRRLLRSPVKLTGVAGLVAAFGYWFVETHPGTCNKIQTEVFQGLLWLAHNLAPKTKNSQQTDDQTQDQKAQEPKAAENAPGNNASPDTNTEDSDN